LGGSVVAKGQPGSSGAEREKLVQRGRSLLRHPGAAGFLVGVAGLICALVFGILTIRPEKTELTVEFLSSEELTIHPDVAGLEGRFFYLAQEVGHLWRTRIRLVNSGTRSLTGVGPSCNVLRGGVQLQFPDESVLLNVELGTNEASATVRGEQNVLSVDFEQWRPAERVELSCLVASDAPLEAPPYPSTDPRQIVDGRVQILASAEGCLAPGFLDTPLA
jgi:hypothetical protein